MRVIRSASPPPRSESPDLIPQPLPSPPPFSRRKTSRTNLRLADIKDSPPPPSRSPDSQSDRKPSFADHCPYPLSNAVADLAIDEFGTKDVVQPSSSPTHEAEGSTIRFPRSELDISSSTSPCRRGHRRSSAVSPRQHYHPLPPPSALARPRPRSRSPPPVLQKSPPPPLPPIPSFLLSAAHKTTEEDGLQHIYISDVNFSCSISSNQPTSNHSHDTSHSRTFSLLVHHR